MAQRNEENLPGCLALALMIRNAEVERWRCVQGKQAYRQEVVDMDDDLGLLQRQRRPMRPD